MKIKFKKKRLIINFLLGLFWTMTSLVRLIDSTQGNWTIVGFLTIGLAHLGIAIFEQLFQYLTIENGTLLKNGIFSYRKKIVLKDIIEIKAFAGEYTLLTDTTELKINTELIAKESLDDLIQLLSALDLPKDKTPFPSAPIGRATHTTETA